MPPVSQPSLSRRRRLAAGSISRSGTTKAGARARTTCGATGSGRGDQGLEVLGGAVALVVVPAEVGIALVQPAHDAISRDLRDDRGGRHACAHRVALLDADRRARDARHGEAVGQHVVGIERLRPPFAAARCSNDAALGIDRRRLGLAGDPRAPATMRAYAASRWGSVSILESQMPSRSNPSGRITAAATSGPANAPRPASSAPAMRTKPCGASRRSYRRDQRSTVLSRSLPSRRGPEDDERIADDVVDGT